MKSKYPYPLIESLGLKVEASLTGTYPVIKALYAIDAEDLEKQLEAATVIHGYKDSVVGPIYWGGVRPVPPTHKALLIGIKETSKEPCKHEPAFNRGIQVGGKEGDVQADCYKCGIRLIAEWKEVK